MRRSELAERPVTVTEQGTRSTEHGPKTQMNRIATGSAARAGPDRDALKKMPARRQRSQLARH